MATRAISVPATRSWTNRPRPAFPVGLVHRFLPPLAGFAVLVSAVAAPLVATLAHHPVTAPAVAPPLPASAITHLDRLPGLPEAARPKSGSPAAGMAFVRCTNLWTALPDGSGAHRLLSMPGLSSPTFSPDARTIAFLARRGGEQEIWTAAADGSRTIPIGAIESDGVPPAATATGLTWSPDGGRLAFALTGGADASWSGSSIWTLDLRYGSLERVGTGWPVPTWIGKQLVVATDGASGPRFQTLLGRRNWLGKRLSSEAADLVAAVSPGWWSGSNADTAVLRRDEGGDLELALRNRPWARDRLVTTPPDGYRISTTTAPAVLEGGPVAVTLIGPDGGRDLGLVDRETGAWTLIDYAWEAAWSPAPPVLGPLPAQCAVALARELLSAWERHPEKAALLLGRSPDPSLAPLRRMGYTFGEPTRMEHGWSVPATVFGRTDRGFAFRRLAVAVRPESGRLAADPVPLTDLEPIRTVHQAVAFLESILTANVLPPAGLPEGTGLAPDAVRAWSWGGKTTGELSLRVPGSSGNGPRHLMTITYGDAGFGCGPTPEPVSLATGTPALATDSGQVAWPAGPKDFRAPYGIFADLPTERVLRVAAAMDAERLARG